MHAASARRFAHDDKPGPINIGDEDLSHLSNWFECLRARNTQTNATAKAEQILNRSPAA